MKTILGTLALSVLISVQSPAYAIDEAGFVSSSKNTRLSIDKNLSNGRYETLVNNDTIFGFYDVTSVQTLNNKISINGDFVDYNQDSVCSGNIFMTLFENIDAKYQLDVKWVIEENPLYSNCIDKPGTEFTITLSEAIPVSDRYGDYTSSNADTLPSETSGYPTWPLWNVSDNEGLNCREGISEVEPNASGMILSLLPFAANLETAYPRSPNAVINDAYTMRPYLRTQYAGTTCWVRANQKYIHPASVVEQWLKIK